MQLTNNENCFKSSPIGNTFKGLLKHEIKVSGESVSHSNLEPFFAISIDFDKSSIESCFTSFFSKKKIESNSTTSLSQQSYLETLPSVLIVHLKSFYYDKSLKQIVKITSSFDYGISFSISKDWLSPSCYHYKNTLYELFSVVIHKGKNASSGHYVCFCKDKSNIWWNLDDTKVYKITEDNLLKMRPYIMFYRKK